VSEVDLHKQLIDVSTRIRRRRQQHVAFLHRQPFDSVVGYLAREMREVLAIFDDRSLYVNPLLFRANLLLSLTRLENYVTGLQGQRRRILDAQALRERQANEIRRDLMAEQRGYICDLERHNADLEKRLEKARALWRKRGAP
jgi:hypothetical protein